MQITMSSYEFGRDLLGPIITKYLRDLDATVKHFAVERKTKILFASRAGVRIQRLYECYTKALNCGYPPNSEIFWISRFMCVKGIWNSNYTASCALLEKEFRYATVRDILVSLYRTCGLPADLDLQDIHLDKSGAEFSDFIWGKSHAAHLARWHLTEQSNAFGKYIDETMGQFKSALIVDSGWQGTVQTLLTDWRSDIDWWGCYFGRSGSSDSDRRYWDKMIGLTFESDTFDLEDFSTSIVLHRHLIEDLFEPRGTSIEHLLELGAHVEAPGAVEILRDAPDSRNSPMFAGVWDYVSTLNRLITPAQIEDAAAQAWPYVARTIVFPTKQEALELGMAKRSADFGRTIQVPLLLKAEARYPSDSAETRISHSLWPGGQAALEYSPDIALARQQIISGARVKPKDFTFLALPDSHESSVSAQSSEPAVSIITRTMDRPIFLKRALRSVADQNFQDFIHVIVCDGGDSDQARKIIEESEVDQTKVILIDNVYNRGMESSSNIGIRASCSEFVIIHDDDDTWHPDFLLHMVSFLRHSSGRKYGGAISHTWYVSEEITQDSIKVRGQRGYHDWVDNVQIMEMAQENFFAPISFLFRRHVCEAIGGFDERFPVLGDWDFNLRFLAVSDIGVVAQKLANYHHRDTGNTQLFANSVVGSISKHAEYNAIMRNKFIRNAEIGSGQGVGILVNLGMSLTDMRNTARRTLSATENIHSTVASTSHIKAEDRSLESVLQQVADQRWIGLACMAQEHSQKKKELIDEIAKLKATEEREISGSQEKTQMLVRIAATERNADDRWLAMHVIASESQGPI